ncbi:MAG: hypothetical protein AAGM21_06930 [Pseudomonadota bacterium]
MKNAAVVLGVLGGVLGMITGFFVYGFVEFLGWFNNEVDQDLLQEPENAGRLVFVGIASPVLAIAGGAMAHPRPTIGGVLLAISVGGMLWAYGAGVFTMFPIVLTGLAALLALLGRATKEPGSL